MDAYMETWRPRATKKGGFGRVNIWPFFTPKTIDHPMWLLISNPISKHGVFFARKPTSSLSYVVGCRGDDLTERLRNVHCDIKPRNILLVSSAAASEVKIADFGLAKKVKVGLDLQYQGCGFRGTAPSVSICLLRLSSTISMSRRRPCGDDARRGRDGLFEQLPRQRSWEEMAPVCEGDGDSNPSSAIFPDFIPLEVSDVMEIEDEETPDFIPLDAGSGSGSSAATSAVAPQSLPPESLCRPRLDMPFFPPHLLMMR
ncbi:hypothetical protein ACLOJK_035850 [Asimina triloba]